MKNCQIPIPNKFPGANKDVKTFLCGKYLERTGRTLGVTEDICAKCDDKSFEIMCSKLKKISEKLAKRKMPTK